MFSVSMKSFLFTILVFMVYLLQQGEAYSTTSSDENDKVYKIGTLCSRFYCSEKEGYFDEKTFFVNRLKPYTSYKLLFNNRPTTFVLYFKNFKNFSSSTKPIRICTNKRCQDLKSFEDQVLIFTDINQLSLFIKDESIQVDIQYFIGCRAVSGDTIDKKVGAVDNMFRSCWILTSQKDVAATNIFLTNLSVPEKRELEVYDLITDECLLKISNSTENKWTQIKSKNDKYSYVKKTSFSLLSLVKLESCEDRNCDDVGFKLQLQGLNDYNLSCLEKKQLCEYGLMSSKDTDCEEYVEDEKCPAFDSFVSIMSSKEEKENEDERFLKASDPAWKICKWLCKGKEYEYFCLLKENSERVGCGDFKKCASYCLTLRFGLSICEKKNRLSVFA